MTKPDPKCKVCGGKGFIPSAIWSAWDVHQCGCCSKEVRNLSERSIEESKELARQAAAQLPGGFAVDLFEGEDVVVIDEICQFIFDVGERFNEIKLSEVEKLGTKVIWMYIGPWGASLPDPKNPRSPPLPRLLLELVPPDYPLSLDWADWETYAKHWYEIRVLRNKVACDRIVLALRREARRTS